MDLTRCVDAIERRTNVVYQWNFVRNLKGRMRRKAAAWPGRYDIAPLGGIWTIRGFDDAYTAPHHGFAGASDYYHRASALRVVGPDPRAGADRRLRRRSVRAARAVRRAAGRAATRDHRVLIPRDGGHCGFLAAGPDFDGYWAEATAVDSWRARSCQRDAARAEAVA